MATIKNEIYGYYRNIIESVFKNVFDEYYGEYYDEESLFASLTFINGKHIYPDVVYSKNKFFVMLIDNIIIGYIYFSAVLDEAELLRIAIKDKFKSKGLSNLIMNTYLKYTGDKASSYFLEVRSNNYIARKLYEKYGYQSIATRKNYYSNPVDDAVIYLRQ